VHALPFDARPHVLSMQRPEVQPSAPAHGMPSGCLGAQVPPEQKPDSQSPSFMQAPPFFTSQWLLGVQ
jgi:hypothetical protein